RTCPACAGCHVNLDVVGFGLDNYDQLGQYRSTLYYRFLDSSDHNKGTESVKAGTAGAVRCSIAGQGTFDGASFSGPRELGDRLLLPGRLGRALVTSLSRFARGRHETMDEAAVIDAVAAKFMAGDRRFQSAVQGLVTSDVFGYRRE